MSPSQPSDSRPDQSFDPPSDLSLAEILEHLLVEEDAPEGEDAWVISGTCIVTLTPDDDRASF